jgi:ferredoxin
MGAGLWLHVSKVARPALAPPHRLRWGATAVLVAASIAIPAPLGPAADPLRLPAETPLDLATSWWLPLTEGAPPWLVWTVALGGVAIALLVPRVTRRARTGSWTPSVVDPRLCTGCDQCTQDCPWEAITMVPRDDDRPSLVALVDPALCVSCGICAGSCAPMGVGPPGRTGRDQLSDIRLHLAPVVRAGPPDTRVVVACCAQTPRSLRTRLGQAGARLHEVPCVGGLHSSVVELLLRSGAAGVMIAGCPPRDCVGREGPKWLEQRLFHDREAELQPRVDRRRVRVVTAAAGLDDATVAAFEAFRRELPSFDVPAAEESFDLVAECETEPSEAGA